MDLAGKVAVITGGTKGIGLAIAKDLIQNGASRVIVSGRDVWEGGKALKILTDLSDSYGNCQKAIYVPTDVTSEEGLKGTYKQYCDILTCWISVSQTVGRKSIFGGSRELFLII